MSEKAIYLHHQRDTMTNLFSDLGTRELGYGEDDDYIGYKMEQSEERWIPSFGTSILQPDDVNITAIGRFGVGTEIGKSFTVKAGNSDGLVICTDTTVPVAIYVEDDDAGRLMLRDGVTNRISLHGNVSTDSWINAGNLAIGHSSPSEKLDISGSLNVSGDGTVLGDFNVAGDGTVLGGFGVGTVTGYKASVKASDGDGLALINSTGVSALFSVEDTNAARLRLLDGVTTRVSLHSDPSSDSWINSGDFGLGNSSPSEKLDVTGSLNVSGDGTFLGGNITINASEAKINLEGADSQTKLHSNTNLSTQDSKMLSIEADWNNTNVASIDVYTGPDTTNKDEAYMTFSLADGGVLSEIMYLSRTGAIGINTTPQESSSGNNSVSFGNENYVTYEDNAFNMTQNAYLDTDDSWKYKTTDDAVAYRQASGRHRFRVAANGDSGDPVSWSDAVLIYNDGKVMIGSTEPRSKLQVQVNSSSYGTPGLMVHDTSGDLIGLGIYTGTQNWDFISITSTGVDYFGIRDSTASTTPLRVEVEAPTDSIHIDTSGRVGLGEASPAEVLDVAGSLNVQGAGTFSGNLLYSRGGDTTQLFTIKSNSVNKGRWGYSSVIDSFVINHNESGVTFADGNGIVIKNNLVAIGTNGPKELLDVAGSMSVEGDGTFLNDVFMTTGGTLTMGDVKFTTTDLGGDQTDLTITLDQCDSSLFVKSSIGTTLLEVAPYGYDSFQSIVTAHAIKGDGGVKAGLGCVQYNDDGPFLFLEGSSASGAYGSSFTFADDAAATLEGWFKVKTVDKIGTMDGDFFVPLYTLASPA